MNKFLTIAALTCSTLNAECTCCECGTYEDYMISKIEYLDEVIDEMLEMIRVLNARVENIERKDE